MSKQAGKERWPEISAGSMTSPVKTDAIYFQTPPPFISIFLWGTADVVLSD
jgi:hypothetical protein